MSRKIISFISFLMMITGFHGLHAQVKTPRGWIQFEDTVHNFGVIQELGGSVEHTFNFVNNGNADILIEKVRASCGCTTPGWTETVIAPGDSGFVKAKFDPSNRPGPFNKMLFVVSDAENFDVLLRIRGRVEPRSRTPADDYPMKIGNTRFKSRVINMGKVLSNQEVKRSVKVYNDSEKQLVFSKNSVVPDHIKLTIKPDTLDPASAGLMILSYDPVIRGDLGYSNDQIILFTNEGTESEKKLTVVATVEEYFPPMTAEEREAAPRLSVEDPGYDFGSVSEGDRLEYRFQLLNEGKSELKIRKLKSNCTCITVKPGAETIAPGQSVPLDVVFDTTDRGGYQYKTISIFVNDPAKPTHVLTIKGKVQRNN